MMGEYQKGEGATDFSSEGTEVGETEIISLVDRKGQGSKAVEGNKGGRRDGELDFGFGSARREPQRRESNKDARR